MCPWNMKKTNFIVHTDVKNDGFWSCFFNLSWHLYDVSRALECSQKGAMAMTKLGILIIISIYSNLHAKNVFWLITSTTPMPTRLLDATSVRLVPHEINERVTSFFSCSSMDFKSYYRRVLQANLEVPLTLLSTSINLKRKRNISVLHTGWTGSTQTVFDSVSQQTLDHFKL